MILLRPGPWVTFRYGAVKSLSRFSRLLERLSVGASLCGRPLFIKQESLEGMGRPQSDAPFLSSKNHWKHGAPHGGTPPSYQARIIGSMGRPTEGRPLLIKQESLEAWGAPRRDAPFLSSKNHWKHGAPHGGTPPSYQARIIGSMGRPTEGRPLLIKQESLEAW